MEHLNKNTVKTSIQIQDTSASCLGDTVIQYCTLSFLMSTFRYIVQGHVMLIAQIPQQDKWTKYTVLAIA